MLADDMESVGLFAIVGGQLVGFDEEGGSGREVLSSED